MTSMKQMQLSPIRPRSSSQPPLTNHNSRHRPINNNQDMTLKKLDSGDWSLDGKRIRSAMSQSLDGREVGFYTYIVE